MPAPYFLALSDKTIIVEQRASRSSGRIVLEAPELASMLSKLFYRPLLEVLILLVLLGQMRSVVVLLCIFRHVSGKPETFNPVQSYRQLAERLW